MTPSRLSEPADLRAYASQTRLDPRTPPDALDSVLESLVRHITRRMHAGGHQGRTLVLRVRFDDQTHRSASHTLTLPTSHMAPILTTLRTLLEESMPEIEARGISLLGVTVGNLQPDPGQLELAVAA
jgi:DNA polymerase-4